MNIPLTLIANFATSLAVVAAMGCSASNRPAFRRSDPAFTPRPGPTPRVYLASNIADLPKEAMRSVGFIQVTVPGDSGISRAIEVATAKGRDLGCWILIEHGAFATVQSSAPLDHGASIILAHGPGLHIRGPVGPKGKLTAKFDCVMQMTTPRAAFV